MTLIQNQYYQATILLSGLKVAASNARVKEEFEKIGFKDVTVTGSARVREAKGCWIGQTQATEIPSPNGVKITDVKKI
ncbi:hypothetical protein WSM22_02940 [Cytophagales bacterium WSM2-2]|nr:hypothetical protein WSM22_02940 [Cytophagales bacterium WSM2-2]